MHLIPYLAVSLSLSAAAWACDGGADVGDGADASTAPVGKGDGVFDPADSERFIGVMPDFASALGVKVHALIEELAPTFERALYNELGGRLVQATYGFGGPSAGYSRATSLVWVRDYEPIVVGTPAGAVVVSYLSQDALRSGFTGSSYVPVAAPSPAHQFYRTPDGGGVWRVTEALPLVHENGNLVATGRWLIVTDKLLRMNTGPFEGSDARHLRDAGWKVRATDEVLDLFAAATRTERERIIVLPPMPGEKTAHADLVVMALGPDEVMVPELRDDILGLITFGHEIELGWRVREYLDAVATTLEERGLEVQRLPMLAPVFLESDATQPTGWNGVFFSPTNALSLTLGDEAPRVYLPTFDPVGFPDAYRALAGAYEAEQVAFFEARGATVTRFEATTLGRAYGLFRCVTTPIF